MKTKLDKEIAREALAGQLGAIPLDAWILMLSLGGLGHILNLPKLAINYWASILVIIISICLFIQPHTIRPTLKAILKQLEASSEEGSQMKYIDRYGQIWVRIGLKHVQRVKDGNIGGWYNGEGLSETSL